MAGLCGVFIIIIFFILSSFPLKPRELYTYKKKERNQVCEGKKTQVKEPSLWASLWAREPSRIQILCPHSMILTAVREGFIAVQGNP